MIIFSSNSSYLFSNIIPHSWQEVMPALCKINTINMKHLFVSNQFLHKTCQNVDSFFWYLLLLLGAVPNPKISDAVRSHKSWFCYLGQAQLFDTVTFLGFFFIEYPYVWSTCRQVKQKEKNEVVHNFTLAILWCSLWKLFHLISEKMSLSIHVAKVILQSWCFWSLT